MTPCCTLLSLWALLTFSPGAGAAQAAPAGLGWVSGKASTEALLECKGAPPPPAYENNGYRQLVSGAPGSWTVTVSVEPGPMRVRAPFRPGRLPESLPLKPPQRAALTRALADCQRVDEAVNAVLLFVRTSLKYVQRPDFKESTEEVFKRGEGSCVGATRASLDILRALGIGCREVVGLELPPSGAPTLLEGGMLHAWLEVDFPDAGSAFYDPFRSCGWVPADYLMLRRGGGLAPGDLEAFSGGKVRVLNRRDRLFFEPASATACVLWARPQVAAFTGTLVSAKVLGPLDLPVDGQASLEGEGSSASMDLWQGNCFFRDLEPGHYVLSITPKGGKTTRFPVAIRSMDKRFLLLYSQSDGEVRAGALDEPGR